MDEISMDFRRLFAEVAVRHSGLPSNIRLFPKSSVKTELSTRSRDS
jgi:hypothetical protein